MKINLINITIILLSLISFVLNLLNHSQMNSAYQFLWMQPFVYFLVYIFIFMPLLNKKKYKITVYFVIILSLIRLVIIPLFSNLSGLYNGVSYVFVSDNSIQIAIFLVIYEFIITSLVLAYFVNSKSNSIKENTTETNLELKGSKIVYLIFILFAVILYITIGRNLNLINFFFISISEQRFGDITSTYLVLLRQIFKVAMIFLFVFTAYKFKILFDRTGQQKYVYFAILIGILNVGMIMGERRSEQIYTLLVVLFILTILFKTHRKKIILFVSSVAILVLMFMSVYKHFAAFYYGSYFDAIGTSNLDLTFLTQTLQSYFFGTQNVAMAVEFSNNVTLLNANIIYDYFRSIFGFNFILKEKMIMTTEYFNSFIYGFNKPGGHVLSGVGYGYIYFGFIFSPVIVILNIYIAIKLEKLFNRTSSIEMKYILGYMVVRFATNIYVNTPPLISLTTIMIFTAGLLYIFAVMIGRINNKTIET